MKIIRTTALIGFLLSNVLVTVHASTGATSPSTVSSSQVGRMQTVQEGTVTAVRDITIQNESSRSARVTGAALGGIAGSAIGSNSRTNAAGAVAGASAGRAIGNSVSSSNQAGIEITVRLTNNSTISVSQVGSSNEFRVGDLVKVTSNGETYWVTRN